MRANMLGMILRQEAPVQVWLQVVGRMVAIVKQEEVKGITTEIAGMVIWMIFITTVVLEIIGPNYTPGRILVRYDPEQQGAFPIDDKQDYIGEYH